MDLGLVGKNALVCGASKGIGLACAQSLSELGANVTILARTRKLLQENMNKLTLSNGQNHEFLVADLSDLKDLQVKVKKCLEQNVFHILVNNAGGPAAGPLMEADLGQFTKAFSQHLLCNQALAKLLVPGMKREGYGRIINIVSTSVKEPIDGIGVSNTIRGAVGNWAKTLANELGPFGITVNNVLPGLTDTERLHELHRYRATLTGKTAEVIKLEAVAKVPLRRIGKPSEIAAGVAFLASPAASYITGTNLTVDGGRTRSL